MPSDRKPWMTPIYYNDWFPDSDAAPEAMPEPEPKQVRETTEADLMGGTIDEPLPEGEGLMDEDEVGPLRDFDSTDDEPCDYENGPDPEREYGLDDDDEAYDEE